VFPFDTLKIDSSFISSLEQESESRKIVGAIIALGQNLGLTTIATGVERQSQAELLMRMGCSAAQGWLYGHPVPACDVEALLQAEKPREALDAASVLAGSSAYHLLKAEERKTHLEAAYNTTPLGLAYLDPAFRYVSVNETYAGMFGRKVGVFVGHSVAEILPDLSLQLMACLEQTLTTGVVTECEIVLSHPDNDQGQLVYLHTCQSVREPYGGVIGFSIALVDITGRKKSEAALRRSEGNYRLADEFNPHISWTADPDGLHIEVNHRWQTLTSRRAGLLSIEEWLGSIHPEDITSARELWAASVRTGEAYEAEYRVSRGDGGLHWVRARATAAHGVQGEIARWYGIVEDIDHQKQIEEVAREKTERLEVATRQLELLARKDHLTGLANRRCFDEVLQRELRLAVRSQLPLALVMIDIDYFKSFNDDYGHVAGDACLRRLATVLTEILQRPTDLAARYGGEEFALILPNTTREGAVHIAEHALSAVDVLALVHKGNPLKKVTLSAGVAMFEHNSGSKGRSRAAHLVQSADLALYAAKKAGRARVAVATHPITLADIVN
jgi:diguanylate cyclase (GGDEF)-like protein/PAS domain S-box-containing protein